MTRFKYAIYFFIICHTLSYSQVEEEIVSLTLRAQPSIQSKEAITDTIELPIIDDFSGNSIYPTERYWMDKKVYINSSHSKNPISIGVATFDGLNDEGFPYHKSNNSSDTLADVLTSRYINLSGKTNVFLSFYYQSGGLGESPSSDDSLVVEFWSPIDTAWEQVWARLGSGSGNFTPAIIAIDSAKWLNNGFQFRFGAYGARNGAFDIWNLDYVFLASNRSGNDSVVQDPAFSRPLPSFIRTHENIPWFHFNTTEFKDTLNAIYRRNGPTPSPPWTLTKNKFTLFKNGSIDFTGSSFLNSSDPHNNDLINPLNIDSYDPSPISDSFCLKVIAVLPGDKVNPFTENDTLTGTQHFYNYYSYDDGSAERGYGVKNVFGARMAFEFQPLQPDTLKGVYYRFVHAGVNAEQYSFKIAVWENNGGTPGNLIYSSDSNYIPDYGYYHNSMVPYPLDTSGIFINGSVFIGMIQLTDQPIHVGLDLNNINKTNVFYGDNVFWYQSLTNGSLMIRPYYRYQPHDISIDEDISQGEVNIYPNPANDILHINQTGFETYELFDLNGRILLNGKLEPSVDISMLDAGSYILILKNGSSISSHKILVY